MTVTTPQGRVLRDAQGARLEFVRTFDAPITDVWSAITDSDRLARWYGSWTGDPTTGTVEVLMTAEEGATPETVRIIACEAPTSLVVEVPSPDGPWHLDASLREEDGVTTLHFVQRLAEPYDASDIGPGWQFYLDRLDAVLSGSVLPEDWDAYHPALKGRYEVPSA